MTTAIAAALQQCPGSDAVGPSGLGHHARWMMLTGPLVGRQQQPCWLLLPPGPLCSQDQYLLDTKNELSPRMKHIAA